MQRKKRGGEGWTSETKFRKFLLAPIRYTITDPAVPVEFMSFTVESGVTGSGVG